ncbi:MAG: hypothetical protein J6U00_07340 [Ruminococcus sp.]|jgi:hypothetical protein|uniref:hypothetical protein n=1 Tax=Ruminococcus sp. TaxID=41978 RepID=UPI001B01D94B|nr:hypothetical protein [Ruminococcus sp.]MBO7473803.1 hypothetical protein [Ruminococcus sp.]
MKRTLEISSIEKQTNSTANKSVIIPILLIFVFIITLYFFGICTFGGMQYTTSDYYDTLIHKFEVSASHDEAVAAARSSIIVLRALVMFSIIAAVSSVAGIVLCIKTVIKSIKLKMQLKA